MDLVTTTTRAADPSTPRPGRGFVEGLAAGAVGTAVLNAVGYADMAWRGRDASAVPGQVVDALAARLDLHVGGSQRERANRRTAFGALSGTVAGLATGALVGTARRAGLRLPVGVGGLVTGAAAMAATDLPAHALGVTDVRTWTAQDWVSDAVPHLAFGLAAHSTLRRFDAARGSRTGSTVVLDRPTRASGGLLLRSALLGLAAGGRSSLGLAGPAITGSSAAAQFAAISGLAAEVVADKQPGAPDRTDPAVLPVRLVSGAAGAAVLARRAHARSALPVLLGTAGALAGSFAGVSYRAWAARYVPDWQAAIAEDVAATTLAVLASRSR